MQNRQIIIMKKKGGKEETEGKGVSSFFSIARTNNVDI